MNPTHHQEQTARARRRVHHPMMPMRCSSDGECATSYIGEQTMKLNKAYKPELIACTDDTRPHISHPYLDTKDSKVVATNGHSLVVLPCALNEGDVDGHIDSAALGIARKATLRSDGELELGCGKVHTYHTKDCAQCEQPRPDDGQFPDYRQVVPDMDGAKTIKLGLNAELLWKLAQAMGASKGRKNDIDNASARVVLTIKVRQDGQPGSDAIEVRCEGDIEALGVIMPIRVV